ncbi:uncharacterized protein LOC117645084 [Thrips palmi]|uniref:Uncharacterized protein LOC117645084 n=1 Tax=Thrips palmi TaxID=161013 RepID=A0A6P8ZMN0_THRPL|nr:uncharacterized protein LOC117645084 [Thrips palmi]
MDSNGGTGRANAALSAESARNGTGAAGPSRRSNQNPSSPSASPPVTRGVKRKSGDNQVRQRKLDTALARAMYATGVPLTKLANPYWSKFFALLQYAPPTPDELSNALLEQEYKQCQAKTEELTHKADCLGIMAGYFPNVRLDSIINIIVTTPQPAIWTQKNYLGNRGKDEIGNELLTAINKIGSQKFWLLVTNCNEDGYAADKVIEKYSHITQVKCASQCWDLLVGDLICSVPEFTVRFLQARDIVKHFKFCSERLAVFKENQAEIYGESARTLKRPGAISWAQGVRMMISVIENQEALRESVQTAPDIDENIKNHVLEEDFWKEIRCFSEILTRIHAAITYIAGTQARLSDVYHIHVLIIEWVRSNLSKLGLRERARQVDDVLIESMGNLVAPIHLAAYLLDDRYEGRGLDSEGERQARECIGSLRSHPGLEAVEEDKKEDRIAQSIISMPPSAAECGRRRSEHAFIHSKARNRLTDDRAAKLVKIRCTLQADLSKRKSSGRAPMTVQQLEEYFARYPEIAEVAADSEDEEEREVLPPLKRQTRIDEYFPSRAPNSSRASSECVALSSAERSSSGIIKFFRKS